tara:strand:+ start:565 stop:777 length:213 start_codon:yes stop_codon:yes gene_type:complete
MKIDTGASLRVAQAKNKVSGSELARVFSVHPQQVMRWRTGRDMKVTLAMRLSNHFGITLAEFIELGIDHG